MKPPSVESFHTALFCRRWNECVIFYRDVLGFKPVDEKPGFIEFEVIPGSRIGLIERRGNRAEKNKDASFILSFRVGNLDELQKTLSARCEGVTAVKQHPWGAYVFELQDPEERRLEFWTPL